MRISPLLLCYVLVSLTASAGCSHGGSDGAHGDGGSVPDALDAHGDATHPGSGPINDPGDVGPGSGAGTGADSGPGAHLDGSVADPNARMDAGRDARGKDAGGLSLERRIEDAIASIQADTCFAQEDTSSCEWADYEIGPAQLDMARSTGEAVLMIDDLGAGFFPQFVRYRNRILGYYRINGDKVELDVLSVHLPKRLGDVLASFAGPEFIPASALGRLSEPIRQMYSKLNLLYYGHGGVVFSHLVELVPEQPLVLMDLAHLFDIPPAACQGLDAQTLAAATAHMAAIADSLKQVMTQNNVRFINASFGSTIDTLTTDWSRTCASALPSNEQLRQLLHVYDPIYTALFDSEGVITSHAAANLGSPEDFPFDQVSAQYPNRVRVGFISSLSSGLDDAGRGDVHKKDQFPADGDADVYFNWGCEGFDVCADPHYQLAGDFGLNGGPMPLMSSSYINPLGVARMVNLRYANHGDEPMSNALVRTLERELTPSLCGAGGNEPCVYQDPIVHRQLEPYRLHYE